MAQPILSLKNIIKRFGQAVAVNNVSLDIFSGEIVALLGENGAGKSTLIKILAGIYEKDGGLIEFHNKEIKSAKSLAVDNKTPIAFIHQDLGLVDWMTVAENMAFVMGFPRNLGLIDWKAMQAQAQKALDFIGVNFDVNMRVFNLTRTEKALLAIARAIAVNAEILVLDEPTASLPASDVKYLFTVLNRLREQGVGMIYVTHRLDEVMEMADRILVMRDGFPVAEGDRKNYDLKSLVQAIVGEESKADHKMPLPVNAPELLSFENVVVGDVGPVNFKLHKGEIIALAGLRGAGQEEIGRLLFGMHSLDSGNIIFNGESYTANSPSEAIEKGVTLVAGDRVNESVFMSMTTSENLFVNPMLSKHKPLGYYRKRDEIKESWFKMQLFDIRPKNLFIDISALSGGNQQKIVLARWMHLNTPLLILEDPTAGVDVGARSEIYDLLNKALKEGISIIVITTDFEEIAHLCNKALLFNRGEIVGALENEEVNFANLLALASNAPSKTNSSSLSNQI